MSFSAFQISLTSMNRRRDHNIDDFFRQRYSRTSRSSNHEKNNHQDRTDLHICRHKSRTRRNESRSRRSSIDSFFRRRYSLTSTLSDLGENKQQNPTDLHTSNYTPRTLRNDFRSRRSVLPIFPTTSEDSREYLLLPNVSATLLSHDELQHRAQAQKNNAPFDLDIVNLHYRSHLVEFVQRNYLDLMIRFQINATILDCNYYRLRFCLDRFASERIRYLQSSSLQLQLPEHELPLAMRIFLQMDVDLFYCREANEPFFCEQEPTIRHTMRPCYRCDLCCTYHSRRGFPPSPVRFRSLEKFTFLNGYQTILNESVSCRTTNVLFALRCPCNEYEYVGQTGLSFRACLRGVREASMYHIQKFLLGEKNMRWYVDKTFPIDDDTETSFSDYECFYNHLPRCSTAMQSFLRYNPSYWAFVPMSQMEIDMKDHVVVSDRTRTTTNTERTNIADTNDAQGRPFLQNLPHPPNDYHFTEAQYAEQSRFFRHEHHRYFPRTQVNLFTATVIAVLPSNGSCVFRQFIQSLFVTHSEANLNAIGHLVLSDKSTHNTPIITSQSNRLPRGSWCRYLAR